MKYKVNDRVKVKSLQWYNENTDDNHNVVFADGWYFTEPMSNFCDKELIIESISYATNPPHYIMKDNIFAWTDEMIEELVEPVDCKKCGLVHMSTRCLSMDNCPHNKQKNVIDLPEGYIFKDENGNVINATKIVLEKKKEYPKTYEECAGKIMRVELWNTLWGEDATEYEEQTEDLIDAFIRLKICRDAYWKIAGEEMRLGKPWKPDWNNISDKYCIYFVSGDVWLKECQTRQCPFAFPIPEMRDAFYENFKSEIESCKKLL